jgi:glyoxylase-like metal-dependent hydrolase (beta-lactamase superfamily II)
VTAGGAPGNPRSDPCYVRQLLAGRDFAVADDFAGQMANFVYAIGDRVSGEAVLVDPAYAPDELVGLLEADGMRPVGAVLTHYHADHAGGSLGGIATIDGVAELLARVDLPVHVQSPEVAWLRESTGLPAAAFVAHDPGDVVRLGDIELTLLHTPGHTPGSQCVLVGGRLVTGDTLFLEGCGRTDLPGGDGPALYQSIMATIGALPDETTVLPGHHYSAEPSAALGSLRTTNPVLVPRAVQSWLAAFTS